MYDKLGKQMLRKHARNKNNIDNSLVHALGSNFNGGNAAD